MTRIEPDRALRTAGALALALELVAVPAIFPDFRVYQLSVALTYAIAILGLNILMGFNGQISVAQGVFFAVGAYTSAILMTRYGINYLVTLPAAVMTAAMLGLRARRASRTRLQPRGPNPVRAPPRRGSAPAGGRNRGGRAQDSGRRWLSS